MNTHSKSTQSNTVTAKAVYTKPVLKNAGSLAELTQGFAGSTPDEQGGHTKRNPFQG
jgi:hypothetical protein